MPVVIVISRDSIPATVMWFQRIVRPAHAGVLIADHDPLPGEAQCPDWWSVHILHTPLDDRRFTRRDAKVRDRWIFDPTGRSIGIYARHVRTSSEGLYQRSVGARDQHVRDPERLISYAPGAEEILKGNLSAGGMLSQGIVNKPALRVLVSHAIASVDVSLVGKEDDDRCAPAVRCLSKYLRRDLVHRSEPGRWRISPT